MIHVEKHFSHQAEYGWDQRSAPTSFAAVLILDDFSAVRRACNVEEIIVKICQRRQRVEYCRRVKHDGGVDLLTQTFGDL